MNVPRRKRLFKARFTATSARLLPQIFDWELLLGDSMHMQVSIVFASTSSLTSLYPAHHIGVYIAPECPWQPRTEKIFR